MSYSLFVSTVPPPSFLSFLCWNVNPNTLFDRFVCEWTLLFSPFLFCFCFFFHFFFLFSCFFRVRVFSLRVRWRALSPSLLLSLRLCLYRYVLTSPTCRKGKWERERGHPEQPSSVLTSTKHTCTQRSTGLTLAKSEMTEGNAKRSTASEVVCTRALAPLCLSLFLLLFPLDLVGRVSPFAQEEEPLPPLVFFATSHS